MNALNSIILLLAALLAVFCEAALPVPRHWLGAQIDLLPGLMVYAGLFAGMNTVTLVSVVGGLSFDALSENQLGVSVLPLFSIGFLIHIQRELVLRDEIFAQFVLGLLASAAAPIVSLLLLMSFGHTPLLGWGSLWQWIVMTAGGAAATPIIFRVLQLCDHALNYRPVFQTSFRPEREIRRGRK